MEQEIDILSSIGANSIASVQVLTLYIPSTDQNGRPIETQEAWVMEAGTLLCDIGGGVTIQPKCRGGWKSPNGKIVWDEPVILFTFIIGEEFIANLNRLRNFLHRLGRETGQGEVAFQLDGHFYRITEYDSGN